MHFSCFITFEPLFFEFWLNITNYYNILFLCNLLIYTNHARILYCKNIFCNFTWCASQKKTCSFITYNMSIFIAGRSRYILTLDDSIIHINIIFYNDKNIFCKHNIFLNIIYVICIINVIHNQQYVDFYFSTFKIHFDITCFDNTFMFIIL